MSSTKQPYGGIYDRDGWVETDEMIYYSHDQFLALAHEHGVQLRFESGDGYEAINWDTDAVSKINGRKFDEIRSELNNHMKREHLKRKRRNYKKIKPQLKKTCS